MRYFLTGATGFIGGRLARQLAAAGHHVVAVVRDPAAAGELAALSIELHRGDVTDRESLRRPMTGADGVFHVAGWYKIGVRDKTPGRRVNVEGTEHVLSLMQELGIPKGVYTSTLAINSDTRGQVVDETYRFAGRHLTVYDETKATAHAIAEKYIANGFPLVIVQPGLVYGPGDTSGVRTMLRQYLAGKLPGVPAGTTYAWAHVDDIARGHVLAMERGTPGRSYFLAGPVHTLAEALEMAEAITGVKAPRTRIPPGVLRAAASFMGLVERVVRVPPGATREGLRVVAGVSYVGSHERATRELGWTPRPLREGLAETLGHEQGLR